MKKIISVVLAVVMTFSLGTVAFTASAAEASTSTAIIDSSKINIPTSKEQLAQTGTRVLWNVVQALVDTIVKTIEFVVPGVKFPDKAGYTNDLVLDGMDTYLATPAAGAFWSVGYGSASLQTGNELDGKHYVGGSLSLDKSATEIYDDQRVRVIAMNDGSGRGTVVYAVLDSFGISSGDVQGIRESLKDFSNANNVVGINISVLHQHSCVDTFGMNGPLLKMVALNPLISFSNNFFGTRYATVNGQNKAFMEHLYKAVGDSVKEAVSTMTAGKLYFSETDATKFIRDKRDPQKFNPFISLFRFVPNDGSRETWLFNSSIHCVGNGAAGTAITGDYPYYMEKRVNERANANYILIQGAELAISSQYDAIQDKLDGTETSIERLAVFGESLADLVIDSNAPETEVAPLLNYKAETYYVPVNNVLLSFLGKMGGLSNKVVSKDYNQFYIEVATEIGYLEIGTDIAIAIVPGELEPTIAYGGGFDKTNSWRGTDFNYPTFQEVVGKNKKLLVFGLSNDQIGYILADNDVRSMFTENEELVTTGSVAGSHTAEAFIKLVDDIK